jgi:hypothetical protein
VGERTVARAGHGSRSTLFTCSIAAAELLDVDVDELTRVFALIAPDRFSGFQGIQLIQAEPPQNTLRFR